MPQLGQESATAQRAVVSRLDRAAHTPRGHPDLQECSLDLTYRSKQSPTLNCSVNVSCGGCPFTDRRPAFEDVGAVHEAAQLLPLAVAGACHRDPAVGATV